MIHQSKRRFQPRQLPFDQRIDRSGGPDACWPWTGGKLEGYGYVLVGSRSDGSRRKLKAHRVAYERAFGPIPHGMVICHRCDNPPCCNPAHLFAGTQLDNMRDCAAKGRTHAARGEASPNAKLTSEAVREIRASNESAKALAKKFGVSDGAIRFVRWRRTWKEVA